jgi:ATP-dependent DNA helicase DinG
MTTLTFWPPDSPVLEAKANNHETQGKDSFGVLYLPEAIIRFKQGFGRLIRTKKDKGVVILLDDRILRKAYGKYFIRSLPILSYYQGNSDSVIEEVNKWV